MKSMKWVSAIKVIKIYERQKWLCPYCFDKLSEMNEVHVDHIIPKSQWWWLWYDNIALSCRQCNIIKSSKWVEYIKEYMRPYREWIIKDKKNIREYNQYINMKEKYL